jgi:hypothetical protein
VTPWSRQATSDCKKTVQRFVWSTCRSPEVANRLLALGLLGLRVLRVLPLAVRLEVPTVQQQQGALQLQRHLVRLCKALDPLLRPSRVSLQPEMWRCPAPTLA